MASNVANTTTKPGVLAVMDATQRRLDDSFGGHSFPEFEQARSTVERLESRALDALELLEGIAADHPRTEKLRAALAAFRGEA